MLVELGHFTLVLSLFVAIAQTIVPQAGVITGNSRCMRFAEPAAIVQTILLLFSFAALTRAFVSSDFSVRLVALNSHTDKPMLYKISGVWGNHEGSLLLWVLIVALFGAAAAVHGGRLPATLRARVLSVQGAIGVAFLAFILFTSNPFLRLAQPPLNGQDLNPLLQDPGLAFHPPFLYLGYVGLSMTFSFAVAALLEGRVDAAWGRWVRPWTLAAWVFLTIGIALGSWWAYYELGWGGYWFWDPVENASLMPWIISVALLHCAAVVEKREALKSWTILMAILAFGFSLIGTFIVRSGVLTSVHAFASDPERGLFILLILAVFMGGALCLYAWRATALETRAVFGLVSRETGLVINNVLLLVSAIVVFVGTIWPLVAELMWDQKLSVGPPFFNAAISPFFVLLALVLPVGALLPWKRAKLGRALVLMGPGLVFVVAVAGLVWAMQTGRSAAGPVGAALGAWLFAGAIADLALRAGKGGLWQNRRRLLRLPRSDWGRVVAHAGLGVTIFGVAALEAWEIEDIRVAQIDEPYQVGAYEVTLRGIEEGRGPNYLTTMATIELARAGRLVATLSPEKRIYPVAGMPTTEAAISNGILRDLYVVIGDAQSGGGWAVRTYIKPFANWIWAGCIIMALGGALSLSDRRLRVGASAARAKPATVPEGAAS